MRRIRKSKCAFAVTCLALALASILSAPVLMGQSATTGAITGTVVDSSNAVIPNVKITVTSTATGQARTATSSSSGTYTVGFLPPGTYSVEFEAAGFGTATVPSITVNVTEVPTVNQILSVGSQTTTVEVTTQAELVQTTSATNGTVIDSKTVTDIPLTTRNYTNLMGLSAGVQATVFNAITLGRGSQDIEVNGAGPSQNNYSQDGASINSYSGTGRVGDSGNNPGMAIVNPDAVAEFKIQTAMYDASYGRNPGANVNVVTKSGTNQFHGTAFEFFRNTVLNANDYFRKLNPPPNPTSRPVLNQNQFGGSFGGPIKKDKLFMFLSEQETRQINGAAAQGYALPTLPGIPGGDRSTPAFKAALGAAFGPVGAAGCAGLLSNGTSSVGGVQVACNGSNINPVALNILNLKLSNGAYFVPGSGLSSGANATVAFSQPVHFTEHQVIGNFDYVINQKNTLGFRFFWAHDPAAITMSCAGSGGGANSTGTITACLPGAPGLTNFPAMYDTLRLTTLVTNNFVNEARLSLQTIQAHPVQQIPFTNAQVGIANIIPAEPSLDTIIINNPKIQFGAGNNLANFDDTGAWEAADSISWSHGKHTVRAGFEYERDRVNMIALKLSLGTLTFQTFQDFLLGLPGCSPAQVLAGCSTANPMGTNGSSSGSNLNSTGTNGYGGPNGLTQNFRDNILDGFVQDDFKVSSNLMVNMGLRWEYDGWPIEINGKNTNTWFSNLGGASNIPVGTTVNGVAGTLGSSAATGSLDAWVTASNYNPANYAAPPVAGVGQSPFPGVAQFPKDAFAPRFGVAWKPLSTDRLVVRGGFGIFYDRLGYSFFGRTNGAPPYSSTLGQSGSANFAATFAQPYPAGPYSLGWPTTTIRYATLPNAAGIGGSSSNINTPGPVGPFLPVPTTNQYNLSVQYEFLNGWVLDLGYVGSYAYHLFPQSNFTEHEYNQAMLASPTHPVYGVTLDSTGNASERVPYLGFAPGGLFADETNTWSKYNSFQATVKKQLSHGLTFSAAYSFSRSFSDSYYLNYDDSTISHHGLNGFYRPQRLAINYNWALPISKHEGLVGKAINGWSVSGVSVIQSGDPLTPVDARGGTAYGFGPGTRPLSTAVLLPGKTPSNEASTLSGNDQSRIGCANTVIGASGAGTCSGGGWFNRAAFDQLAFVAPTSGGDGAGIDPNHVAGNFPTLWGNSGYGTTFGPGQFNFDISIQKSTVVGGLHENATLQFRTDFFNAFNHPQFIDPNVDISQPGFGQITATSVNPRLIQFSLKYVF
jgi:Carboxypeptidase regulatory-like domain